MRIKTNIDEEQTFEAAAAAFMLVKQANQIAERTLNDYQQTFAKFAAFGQNTLRYDALCADLLAFFAGIPATSPAVYNRPYSCLRALFNFLVKQGQLQKNPLDDLELHKKRDDGNIKPASVNDVQALLKACDKKTFTGLRNYTMILVMFDTGIRTSELVKLVNEDYDPISKTITVTKDKAKTRRKRVCYLSDLVVGAMNKYMRVKPADVPYIFCTRDCLQLQTNELSREFRKLSAKAKVKVTPYQLRHSFATYFIENGGNVFALQSLMGHSDIRMTIRYTEISEQQQRKAHNEYSPTKLLGQKQRL